MRFKEYLLENTTQTDINSLEKFADNLLKKYDIDVEFTRHFLDRINDNRNDPDITIQELKNFFKKIESKKGMRIKQAGINVEVILKDLSQALNLPTVIEYKRGVFVITHKTIMRKRDFKSNNKFIKYF